MMVRLSELALACQGGKMELGPSTASVPSEVPDALQSVSEKKKGRKRNKKKAVKDQEEVGKLF